MPDLKRLLGLAFATSDLLLEIDATGLVVFALGSGPDADIPPERLIGARLEDALAGANSAAAVLKALADIQPGRRSLPVEILLDCGRGRMRRAQARFFVLPDLAPNVSCAVQYEGPAYSLKQPPPRPVLTPMAFLERARRLLTDPHTGQDLVVAFVDVDGLADAAAAGPEGAQLVARVEAALQAATIEGASAGRLGEERFALLKDRQAEHDLALEVRELGESEGLPLALRSADVEIQAAGHPLYALRALRFAVEGCLANDGPERPELSFAASLARTLKEADAFRHLVRSGGFELHYQPIVDLRSGAVHHFEALARFNAENGPAETIRMAEELAMIDGFDLAVAEKALRRLRQRGAGLLRFALNVSGASLADDRYVQALLRMTSANPDERRRLIVEVTESAALADIEAANRRLGALRAVGVRVCIDDFGAGAASYDYLRGLSVDAVKIDGRFIRDIEHTPRLRTMVGHLVDLCRSLGVETIAERIETKAVADLLADLGVDQGQGWHFGRAEPEPRTLLHPVEPARRTGVVEAWG